MILPLRFLLACAILASSEVTLGPASAQDADAALPLFSLSVALFLACYGVAILCDVIARRASNGLVVWFAALVLRWRWLLPLGFWCAIIFFARWDAWADFGFAAHGLTISSFMMLMPFFVYEGLAVLGEILLHGRVGRAGEDFRSTIFIAPMLFFLTGIFDILSRIDLTRAAIQELGVVRTCVWLAGFACLFLVFPLWFARLFRARPLLPESLRREFESIAHHGRVAVHRIFELPTRGRALNATLVGPFGATRSVFFTDLILARFGIPELRAVFAHELGHARGRHVTRSIAFFIALPLITAEVITAAWFDAGSEWAWSVCVFVCFAVLAGPFFWFRRRFEHEADLYGAKTLGDTTSMIAALRAVEMLVPRSSKRGNLMHPSTTRRIELLELADREPSAIRDWTRRTGRAQAPLFFALGIAIALFVPAAWAELKRDWPGFLLATGRTEAAYEAFHDQDEMAEARRTRGIDEARRAALIAYGPDGSSIDVLRQRALARGRRALQIEDWTAVRGWFGLARRFGTTDELADAVWRYLDADARGDERGRLRETFWIRSLQVPADLRRSIVSLLSRG